MEWQPSFRTPILPNAISAFVSLFLFLQGSPAVALDNSRAAGVTIPKTGSNGQSQSLPIDRLSTNVFRRSDYGLDGDGGAQDGNNMGRGGTQRIERRPLILARKGGESSGGGGVIVTALGPTLWDFYGLSYQNQPGENPAGSPSLSSYGISEMRTTFPKVMATVRSILTKRKDELDYMQADFTRSLLNALTWYPMIFVSQDSNQPAFAMSSESLERAGFSRDNHPIQLAAVYHRSTGLFFFRSFASLDFPGQVGLVLHELIRFGQGGDVKYVRHAELEELTRILTFGLPMPKWALQNVGHGGFTRSAQDHYSTMVQERICRKEFPRLLSTGKWEVIEGRRRKLCQLAGKPETSADELQQEIEAYTDSLRNSIDPRRNKVSEELRGYFLVLSDLATVAYTLHLTSMVEDHNHLDTYRDGMYDALSDDPFKACDQAWFGSCDKVRALRTLVDQMIQRPAPGARSSTIE